MPHTVWGIVILKIKDKNGIILFHCWMGCIPCRVLCNSQTHLDCWKAWRL